jgi:hypothetical protein
LNLNEKISRIKEKSIYIAVALLLTVLNLIAVIVTLIEIPLFIEISSILSAFAILCIVLLWGFSTHMKRTVENTLRPLGETTLLTNETAVYEKISEMFSNLSSNQVIIHSSGLPFVLSPSFIGTRKAVSYRAKVMVDSIHNALRKKVVVVFLLDPRAYAASVKRLNENDKNELPLFERIQTIKDILRGMKNGKYETLEIIRRPSGLAGSYVITQRGEALWAFSVCDSTGKSFDTAFYSSGEKILQLFGKLYNRIDECKDHDFSLESRIHELEKILDEIEAYDNQT